MGSSSPVSLPHHIVIFPFLSKGHTIPLLHLAHLLHRRRLATVTFITTPLNSPFIHSFLAGIDPINIINLPFPENVPNLPSGVESTDQLPSMSLFIPFLMATQLLQPPFENAISNLTTNVTFLISDMFFGWSAESASKFAIPRVVFSGMGLFSSTIHAIICRDVPYAGISDPNQPFKVPGFPQLDFTRADFNPPFHQLDTDVSTRKFLTESRKSNESIKSHAILANTFYELEATYVDYWDREFGPKAWCVGPLCLARPKEVEPSNIARGALMQWLDTRSNMNRPVLYVAFGTQADLSAAQMEQIEVGLEQSGLDFLWVVRAKESVSKEFEERVRERGRLAREWVDQLEILRHESVRGFVSHCGWNSVMESVSSGVPILAWPMMAEQHLNAKFVVEELRIGMRMRARDGTKDGVVMNDDIKEMTRELVLGEKGSMARKKAGDLAEMAAKAMTNDGSSALTLEMMIEELSQKRRDLLTGQLSAGPNLVN